MGNVMVLAPCDHDMQLLADGMRERDVDEIAAASGRDPLSSIRRSVDASVWSRAFFLDKRLMCIAGLALFDNGRLAAPWALSTSALDEHPREFITHSRGVVSDMLAIHPHLFNFVDARNTRSIRWLRRVGFTIHPATPYGVSGLPFHPFEMRA